ncbi:DUF2087 domain-containing protein [Deinococcus radiophilus]|nr:DUF2087 domain-containing protein [Deinococcus radiophilus]UFA50548.1 DUF2087 domain-containing protein [Deinococcus radiophilus]
MQAAELHARAALFRALGQPARLFILRLIWDAPLSGERLSELSGLAPATVSHHLSALREVGLIQTHQDGHHRLHVARHGQLDAALKDLITGRAPVPDPTDPYRDKVLRAFMPHGQLTGIPAQRRKRDVILTELAGLFVPGQTYPEREVNTILSQYHPDFFTLRRELVDGGWLSRESGVYQRSGR